MIPLASDLLIRFRWQMQREGLLASASSPTGFRHSVALGVSTLTFRDVQRLWRRQCKESLAVANKPQSRHAAAPRIAMSAIGTKRTSRHAQPMSAFGGSAHTN